MAMTNINIRIDADKKLKAQELFSSLGLDMTTAIIFSFSSRLNLTVFRLLFANIMQKPKPLLPKLKR